MKRYIFALIVMLVYTTTPNCPAEAMPLLDRGWSPTSLFSTMHSDHVPGEFFVVQDKGGQTITETSRQVYRGDEIILPDGRHYRVTKVKDNKAQAKLLGENKEYLSYLEFFQQVPALPASTDEWRERPVGVYHTHTAESYKPTSGDAFVPFEGDVYAVGESFVQALENENIEVIYYKTPHDPHDNNAYVRSRRTAVGIMKNNPIAIFDIHRDGISNPAVYRANVEGQDIAKVRIVIGRQNPKRAANEDFAKRLMAYAEGLYPGLIKDIFIGRGSYNQDLISTALLLEAGTYTNTVEEAERGIVLFADAVPVILGLTVAENGVVTGTWEEQNRSGWRTAGLLVLITLLGAGAFLLISTGNFEKAVERLTLASRRVTNSTATKSSLERVKAAAQGIRERSSEKAERAHNRLQDISQRLRQNAAKKPENNKQRKNPERKEEDE